jgi:hypothetical protein
VKDFFLMMVVQFIHYTILTLNIRAIAHENYLLIMVTEAGAVCTSYLVVRKIACNENHWTLLGMVIGGVAAGLLGTYLTRN